MLNKKKPVISVVIPVYNGGEKLIQCLESLQKQTIDESFEVLIVDDASTDDTVKRVEEYLRDHPYLESFRIIKNDINGRAGKARNTGVKESKGDYIVFVDQDDYLDGSMLKTLYVLTEKGKYDCTSCDIREVGGKDYHRKKSIEKENLSIEERKEIMSEFGFVFAVLIRKQVLIENSLCFPENVMFEDALYNCGLISCIDSINTTDKTLYYRESDANSQTASLSLKKLQDRVKAVQFYLDNFSKKVRIEPYLELIKQSAFYYIFLSCVWFMMNDHKLYNFEFLKQCYTEGRKLNINWNDVYSTQKQFPISRLRILRLVYYLPILFYVFFFYFMVKKGIKKCFKYIIRKEKI